MEESSRRGLEGRRVGDYERKRAGREMFSAPKIQDRGFLSTRSNAVFRWEKTISGYSPRPAASQGLPKMVKMKIDLTMGHDFYFMAGKYIASRRCCFNWFPVPGHRRPAAEYGSILVKLIG